MVLNEDEARGCSVKELTRLLGGAPQKPLRLLFGPPGPRFADPDFLWSQLTIVFVGGLNNIDPRDHLVMVNYLVEQGLPSLLFQFIVDFPPVNQHVFEKSPG